MEISNHIKERTNIHYRDVNFKVNDRNVQQDHFNSKKSQDPLRTNDNLVKLSVDLETVFKDETVDVERDVSMMSIKDDSQSCRYFLPSAADFVNKTVVQQFYNDVMTRRELNRGLTCKSLDNYFEEILRISRDIDTGNIFIMEILDYMQTLECLHPPLGSNFLEGTVVPITLRNKRINWLFEVCSQLAVDRYSVIGGMAIADRFVMGKGKKFDVKHYKAIVVTSWYLACKVDLLEYPCIADICTLAGVKEWTDISKYEYEILKVINFYLGMPTPISFLRTLTILKQRDNVSHKISKCFTEICVANYHLAGHPAHIIACASYCLAICLSYRKTHIETSWIPIIQYVSGLDIEDIRPVVVTLAKYLRDADLKSEMKAIYIEYQSIIEVIEKRKSDLTAIICNNQENESQ